MKKREGLAFFIQALLIVARKAMILLSPQKDKKFWREARAFPAKKKPQEQKILLKQKEGKRRKHLPFID